MILTVILLLAGCLGQHKIIFDESDVYNCPKHAKAGETVVFDTVLVCDADLYVYVDGAEYETISEGQYQFVMPDHDVEIRVVIVSNGLA